MGIKVAITGTRGLGNYGGFESANLKLANNVSLDFDLYFFITSKSKIKMSNPNIKRKNIFVVPYEEKVLFNEDSNIGNVEIEVKTLNKLLGGKFQNIKFDVIYQCGSTPGLFIKKKPKRQLPVLLWNPDGIEWRRKKFPFYGRWYLYLSTKRGIRISDGVIVDSLNIAYILKKWLRNKFVYYIPAGADILSEEEVNVKYVQAFDLDPYEYYIVVARAVPENHILEILNYFLMSKTTKKLVVVSNIEKSNRYGRKLLDIIKNNRSRIVFTGPIYNLNVLNSLRYFSFAYIHGHSVGGTNPSLVEAMGAGTVPICYDVPFNREVARDSALYFRNFSEFESAINSLERNEKIWNLKKEKAVKIVKDNYTWDYIVELYEIVFLHILTANGFFSKNSFLDFVSNLKYKKNFIRRNFMDTRTPMLR